jgi:hypothetical protein
LVAEVALRGEDDGAVAVAALLAVDGGATAAAKPVVGSGRVEAVGTHEADPTMVEPHRRKMQRVPSRDVQIAAASPPICVTWRTSAAAADVGEVQQMESGKVWEGGRSTSAGQTVAAYCLPT